MSAHSDSGIKRILTIPFVYHLAQFIFGTDRLWKTLVHEFIVPTKGMKILDIGSGTSGILEYLHGFDVEYHGYDLNEDYISSSNNKWSDKGRYYFKATSVNDLKIDNAHKFDVVLALNLLHHLDGTEADRVIEIASEVLKDAGRFIACDPCIFSGMNLIEKFMVHQDRGRNIRTTEQYLSLIKKRFAKVNAFAKHVSMIPQTGVAVEIVECRKG
jgi:2-polyprenyl-3-methyl-5-hydroxy-6-metoxy-1,4-benzoquinol methylase